MTGEELNSEIPRFPHVNSEFLDTHDDAFDQKLRRRFAEIENGTAVGIPAEEVFTRLRKKYN